MSQPAAKQILKGIRFGTYPQRGVDHPVIEFFEGSRVFGFGATKAKRLLQAVKDNGAEAVVKALQDLVAMSDPAWVAEQFGTTPKPKIAAGTGAKKPQPKPQTLKPAAPPADDDDVFLDLGDESNPPPGA